MFSKLVIKNREIAARSNAQGQFVPHIDGALHTKHLAHALDIVLRCSSRMPSLRLREDASNSLRSYAELLIRPCKLLNTVTISLYILRCCRVKLLRVSRRLLYSNLLKPRIALVKRRCTCSEAVSSHLNTGLQIDEQ